MTTIDRSLIGQFSHPFVVEVERGAIRKFADAIGDTDRRCRDVEYARSLGHADVIAPPTFATCFRPPEEPPWMAPLDRRRIVAGQVAFDHVRPIVAGQILTCRVEFVAVEDKDGAKGRMELIHQRLHGVDGEDRAVFTVLRTTVYRSLDQVRTRSLA